MELIKKSIHMTREAGRAVLRTALENDCNVPDQQPDVERVIESRAQIRLEEVKVEPGSVLLSGELLVYVLYEAQTPEHVPASLSLRISFREKQALEGAASGENVHIRWEVEDLSVSPINSRKLGVRSLVAFSLSAEEAYDVQAAVELNGAEELCVLERSMELLRLDVRKKDILRISDEAAVSSGKPNIGRLLWDCVQLRQTDCRLLEGQIDVKGELLLFVLYEGDDEPCTRQWLETALPFRGSVECRECRTDQVPFIDVALSQSTVTAMEDYDGERRLLSVEAALELDIRLYGEERLQILEDVYSPVKRLIPVRQEQVYESLLMKNDSRIRAGERLRLEPGQPGMLQTLNCRGEVRIDSARQVEDGIEAEGAVLLSVLYVSSDDSMPYAVLRGAVPFKQTVEAEGISEDCRFVLQAQLEQLSTALLDQEELEARAVIALNAFVVRVQRRSCITDIQEEPLDPQKLQELPGIVGYRMKAGDTLWALSRQYYTTPERICALNGLDEKEIKPGTQLVLQKTVSQ